MNQRPGTHGLLQHMCFDGRKSMCFKHIVCAPLFIANVKAHVLFFRDRIGSIYVCCLQRSASFADRIDSTRVII